MKHGFDTWNKDYLFSEENKNSQTSQKRKSKKSSTYDEYKEDEDSYSTKLSKKYEDDLEEGYSSRSSYSSYDMEYYAEYSKETQYDNETLKQKRRSVREESPPKWFCGSASEWGSIGEMERTLSKMDSVTPENIYNKRKKRMKFLGSAVIGGMGVLSIATGFVVSGCFSLALMGLLMLTESELPLGALKERYRDKFHSLSAGEKERMEIEAVGVAGKIGAERVEELKKGLSMVAEGMEKLGRDAEKPLSDLRTELQTLETMADLMKKHSRKKEPEPQEQNLNEGLNREFERLAQRASEVLTQEKLAAAVSKISEDLKNLGLDEELPRRLVRLMELDGDESMRREARHLLNNNLRPLIAAFAAVPVDQRDKPQEILNGGTAEENLREGVSALSERIEDLEKRTLNGILLKTEAEKQVLVDKSPRRMK